MKILNKNFVVMVFVFSFMFGLFVQTSFAAGPGGVNLGTAGNFVILSKTGISTTGVTSVVGDIGISPAEATYITGFGLTLPAASAFATSAQVTGKVYAPSYANPTPTYLTTSVSDMQTAYTDAMGRTNPTSTELGAGNIGGLTLLPGLYKWGTGVTIPTDVTLSGGTNDVWIFQIAQNLNISSGKKIILSGGAQASNIFWVVAGQTTIGTTAVFNGNILDQTAIVLNTGATLNGRALAQSAVTLDSNTVSVPSGSSSYTNSSSGGNGLVTSNVTQSTSPIITTVTPSTSYNFGTATLKNGSRGEAVKELQRFLNAKLNLGLVLDGKLGPKTIAVIKKWQKDNGLVVDGLIGVKTKAKMNAQVK